MGRSSFIACMIIIQAGCVPVPKSGEVQPASGMRDTPKFYQIPATFKDGDLICEDPNQPGTCATVADVRQFLHSRKTTP